MRKALFIAVTVATIAGYTAEALACTDASNRRSYFSYERPSLSDQTVRLLIRIAPEDVREAGSIRAQLLGSVQGRSGGYVHIRLVEAAVGTNCVDLGPTDGPIFVVGTLQHGSDGELVLIAQARHQSAPSAFPYGRRDPSFYDQYIVDPAYLGLEEHRREERRDDRP